MTLVMLLKPDEPTVAITNLEPTLEKLRALVHCEWLEPLYLPDRIVMLFDEEARLSSGHQVNLTATLFAARYGHGIMGGILGPVLVLGQADGRGRFTDLPGSALDVVADIVGGLEIAGG